MTPNPTPDLLRWQLSPILALVLDPIENVWVESLGQRVPVPNMNTLAEAVRQAHAQQHRTEPAPAVAVLTAAIAKHASTARYDAVHQHITRSAERYLAAAPQFGAVAQDMAGELADGLAGAAMDGMGPLFTETVVGLSASAIEQMAGHPAIAEAGRQVLAEASSHGAALLSFVQQIAEMHKDGEPDGDEPYDLTTDNAVDDFNGLISQAREMLGIPDPEPVATEADDIDGPPAKFRWNEHKNGRGRWCRWSHCTDSEKLAASDDKRCPWECPDSTIEPVPGFDDTPEAGPALATLNGHVPQGGE